MTAFRIGVVGFSKSTFDQATAATLLAGALDLVLASNPTAAYELVSGLTAQGVPKLAYELAIARGIPTVGFSARQALRVRAGVFAVTKQILVGERFGDESAAFVAYIDALIRIGGGPQSRHEVALFATKLADQAIAREGRLVEHEVEWLGR